MSLSWDEGDGASYLSSISSDGRFVVFHSEASNLVAGDTDGMTDIFVRDRLVGAVEQISVANDGTQLNDGNSDSASVSGDGQIVAFRSGASNLVVDDTNSTWDVFVRDRGVGLTERVSVSSDGAESNGSSESPSLSSSGRFVAFQSTASNLIVGDTNSAPDVFLHDRESGTTERVSVATDGTESNLSLIHISEPTRPY